jgi:hypothetical protein
MPQTDDPPGDLGEAVAAVATQQHVILQFDGDVSKCLDLLA